MVTSVKVLTILGNNLFTKPTILDGAPIGIINLFLCMPFKVSLTTCSTLNTPAVLTSFIFSGVLPSSIPSTRLGLGLEFYYEFTTLPDLYALRGCPFHLPPTTKFWHVKLGSKNALLRHWFARSLANDPLGRYQWT